MREPMIGGAHKRLPAKPGNPRGINQYTRAENPVIVEVPPVVAPEEITTAREALLSRAAPRGASSGVPLSERMAFSVAEVAALCGVSEGVIRRLVHTGDMHAAKMGTEGKGDLRIGREEVLRFFAPPSAQNPQPVEEAPGKAGKRPGAPRVR
jgi:excisionase family DNA binding protein